MKDIFIKPWDSANIRFKQILLDFKTNIYKKNAQRNIRNKDFTIICNNCYAGRIYESLNLPYYTPTVGLYFFAEDYIKFVSNLKNNLYSEMKFIPISRYEQANADLSKNYYPIGLISDNIEIHFLHYNSEAEAMEKWKRRRDRIHWDNIYIMMNDQNNFEDKLMPKFDDISYPKIFFSSMERVGNNVKVIGLYKNRPYVGDMYNDRFKVFEYFNWVDWLNSFVK